MTHKRLCAILIAVLSLMPHVPFIVRAAGAGEPTERIRSALNELYRLVPSSATTAAERRTREAAAAQVMDRLFDWNAMARQTLRQHWEERTPTERQEFTRLFAELFRHAYLTRMSTVDASAFKYTGETITGERATVDTRVVTTRGTQIAVAYALARDGEQGWRVRDVRVEGMSLLESYRTQFASVIARSSYDALVERLRSRAREHG